MGTNKSVDPELPEGFRHDSFGGRRKTHRIKHWKDVGENSKEIVVCGRLWCNGETHDEEGQSYGREIEFVSDDGKTHVVVISNADLQGDCGELRKRFADLGLFISTSRSARDSFSQLLNTIKGRRRIVVVSKAGFHVEGEAPFVSQVFVSPMGHVIHSRTGTIVDDGTPIEPDKEGTDSGLRYRLNPNRGVQDKRVGGSYKAWQEGVGKTIFQEEVDPDTKVGELLLPHFVLGLFSGCAGTVIQFAGEPSSALHFVGGSSRGKSSAQVIGASCWGNPNPDKGVLITCHGTKNAVDMKLMLSNGASIHLDEARTGDDKTIVNLPFQFAGETIKGRLKSDAELRKSLTWKGFMTLSSEKAISHYAARAGDQVTDRVEDAIDAVDVAVSKLAATRTEAFLTLEDEQAIGAPLDAAIEAIWQALADLPPAGSLSSAGGASIWKVPEYPPQVRSPIDQRALGELIRQLDDYAQQDEDFREALRALVGLTPSANRRLFWRQRHIGFRAPGKGIPAQWSLDFYPQQSVPLWTDLEPGTVPVGPIVSVLRNIVRGARRVAGAV